MPRLRQDAEIAFWCTCLKEKKLVLEPMMSTWPEAEFVFKRMTKCGVRDGVRAFFKTNCGGRDGVRAFAALRYALGES